MYDQIYDMMVEAGVAVKKDYPEWMDAYGDIVYEDDALGCKVTHDLIRPEMCIVMDEVGGNTSQKGDGNKGGEKFIVPKGMIPQLEANAQDKHFTLLGLTTIGGDPVMCVIIFAGTIENKLWETGIDIFATAEGEVGDDDFFENNSGPGKRFPGGPTCIFQGKELPCLIRWSKKGSITSEILTDIIATLDQYGVFDRSDGAKPFLLIDGHGSRLGLEFLKYINNLCFGVPYGTALWQVGDSAQQNGAFNMALAFYKTMLIAKKEKLMMQLTIQPHEIIVMVNYAWAHSFARCSSNKKAIAERGWYPLNRVLLLNRGLRATMTEEEQEREATTGIVPYTITNSNDEPRSATFGAIVPYTGSLPNTTLAIYDPKFLSTPRQEPKEKMNFSSGTAAACLDAIVQSNDLMEARGRIKVRRNQGQEFVEEMKKLKGLSTGKIFKLGKCRIGETVFQVVKENAAQKNREIREKQAKQTSSHLAKVQAAEEVRALNKPILSLNCMQLKILLAPLKRKGEKIPTLKADLRLKLAEWDGREGEVVTEAVVLPREDESDDNDDVILREDESNANAELDDQVPQMQAI